MFLFKDIQKKTGDFFEHTERAFKRTTLFGFLNYRQAEIQELEALNEIHRSYFVEDWPDTTSNQGAQVQQALPHLFEIDYSDDKPKPKVPKEYIRDCLRYKNPKEITDLTLECKSTHDFITQSVEARLLAGISSKYEQVNSAIVIFSAELARWFNELASRPCVETTYQEVKLRIEYLNAILEKPVFADEPKSNADFQVQTFIFYTIERLENKILPKIRWFIENQSAREHFNRLMNYTEAYLSHICNSLFYLYSDAHHIKFFDFNAFADRRALHKELDSMMNTELGKMFVVLNKTKKDCTGIQSASTPHVNRFLTESKQPKKEKIITLLNTQQNNNNYPSGIHSVMQKEDLITDFVGCMGCLNDFMLFIKAFHKAYQLCGIGGNYLLYHFLGQYTHALLAAFMEISLRLNQYLQSILLKTHQLYRQHAIDSTESEWRRHYLAFKLNLESAEKELDTCKDALIKLIQGIKQVNLSDYQQDVLHTIKDFTSTVAAITQNTQLLVNSDAALLSGSKELVISRNTPLQPTPLSAESNQRISQNNTSGQASTSLSAMVSSTSNIFNSSSGSTKDAEIQSLLNEATALLQRNRHML